MALGAWEALVRLKRHPALHPSRPEPDRGHAGEGLAGILSASLLVTLRHHAARRWPWRWSAASSLAHACSRRSKWIERSFFPFAVVLQVTPVVAIAPLLLIYLDSRPAAVLVCAFLVAFFPILSNTALGLASADHNLHRPHGRSTGRARWQPAHPACSACPPPCPIFLGGLRIGGGLALIGAIVAEIAAGSAGQGSGLAFRIVEGGLPPQHPAHVRRPDADLG